MGGRNLDPVKVGSGNFSLPQPIAKASLGQSASVFIKDQVGPAGVAPADPLQSREIERFTGGDIADAGGV
ncbi:hypothetical protein A3K48_07215 [candidate division WOR-1 bacterium RIFOXYA12_FULL_52_29]|uniref:Uncharacterized protein n=1 Tax=candidate division WOR-1 bacterium RIFOXYC12_FULL_54_18 TaxID=1802584 RepID=A0A1F4T7N6_UNCSA|nr:MAG: hypothetical protein A3K44_07215 [candidate division WOR-1 bacterium RIFOXYA2_FULL_51_19]OGC18307.1 MAG: hypothetical protein A3K48_07215 [candidate division WOR-1 bacterium RIFOXYA12_FULL_52_29]OGC28724.1 MAG: hypothetical protein A3K49_07215 [candidate division WOR-1 bacterium RIFOXYC12_FULL_54_18]OGC30821.1 MAG: hypothetical protein A2346_05405 [candidate division WOR-1 bacterium RIFOXYB12_FULL_52_16]